METHCCEVVTSAVVSETGTRRELVINDCHCSLKTRRVEHDTALSAASEAVRYLVLAWQQLTSDGYTAFNFVVNYSLLFLCVYVCVRACAPPVALIFQVNALSSTLTSSCSVYG